jgi:protein-S-isoprenylcysteine O-methyltransferase Ste14
MVDSSVDRARTPPREAVLTWRQVVVFVVASLILPAALLAAAGRLDWPAGLVYAGILLFGTLASRALVALKHPDLLAERGRFAEAGNAKAWDRKLMPIVGLVGPLAIIVVVGLDERLGWPPGVSPAVQVGGLALVAAGYLLATWAMIVNRFFSAVVRIQTDRGHDVVSAGPYAFVRHPGYAGAFLAHLVTGPALGSLWALLPTTLVLIGLVARTALEDRALREELPGYEEYASRVRYRLLPGIW